MLVPLDPAGRAAMRPLHVPTPVAVQEGNGRRAGVPARRVALAADRPHRRPLGLRPVVAPGAYHPRLLPD